MKLKWDDIWMKLACDIASRSNDPRLKVGGVIVTSDNESVLSIGYNGDEKGGKSLLQKHTVHGVCVIRPIISICVGEHSKIGSSTACGAVLQKQIWKTLI